MVLLSIVRQFRREPAEARASADETVAFCDAHEIGQERAWVLPVRGWAVAALGRTDEGIASLRESISTYIASGSQHTLPYYQLLLAESLLAAGSTRDALAQCETALATAARIGEIAYDAELHRLRGECLRRAEGASAAEAGEELDAALRIACAHGARVYELRAATSLASLWRVQGRAAEARTLLATTLDSFTEGLDTADLRDARHLLGELTART